MRVLILGANGGLGRAFCEGLDRTSIKFEALTKGDLDVSDHTAILNHFHRLKPSHVINCAAYTAVDKAEENVEIADQINHLAVRNLSRLSQKMGFQLIHFSTDYVFDGAAQRPYRESDRPNPLSVYGKTKHLSEIAALRDSRNLVIRTSWLYSEIGKSFPEKILAKAIQGHPPKVVDDQWASPTYAPDLVWATLELISRGATGLFHFSGEGKTNWFEFAQRICEIYSQLSGTELPTPQPIATSELRLKAVRPPFSYLDNSKIKSLGIMPPTWESSLRRYVKNLLANPPAVLSSEANP